MNVFKEERIVLILRLEKELHLQQMLEFGNIRKVVLLKLRRNN
nr:MAG TPA: hypothetical protein [Caudoviricetes sp.]